MITSAEDSSVGWLHPGPHQRRWYGRLAAVVFVVVAVAAAWRLPPINLDWSWIALSVCFLWGSILLLAAEYRLSGWLLDHQITWQEALRVTILSSAANLLPLPGGLAVRSQALRRKGPGWKAAVGSNLVMGLGWLGVALLLAGGLLYGQASSLVTGCFLIGGGLVVVGLLISVARIGRIRGTMRSTGAILLVEGVYVGVSALRLYAILLGIGIEVTYAQATTLTVASALAAGAGIFPGGLGVREVLAGAIAPLAGMAPEVGAFAGVLDRVVSLLVRGAIAGCLWGWKARATVAESAERSRDRREGC